MVSNWNVCLSVICLFKEIGRHSFNPQSVLINFLNRALDKVTLSLLNLGESSPKQLSPNTVFGVSPVENNGHGQAIIKRM